MVHYGVVDNDRIRKERGICRYQSPENDPPQTATLLTNHKTDEYTQLLYIAIFFCFFIIVGLFPKSTHLTGLLFQPRIIKFVTDC